MVGQGQAALKTKPPFGVPHRAQSFPGFCEWIAKSSLGGRKGNLKKKRRAEDNKDFMWIIASSIADKSSGATTGEIVESCRDNKIHLTRRRIYDILQSFESRGLIGVVINRGYYGRTTYWRLRNARRTN